MSIEKLYDTLSLISTGRKTGNLVILVSKQRFSKKVGTFLFREGELVRANFQQKSGRAAISDLLELDVQDVNFTEFSIIAESCPDTPTTADLMQQIKAKNNSQKALRINIQNEVLQLLVSRFGASAVAKVDAIAQQFSPLENPVAFLDKCKSLIEMTSGKEKAEKVFAGLYEQFKNQQ